MTASIVILNWNGRDFLRKYLPCLLDSVKEYDDVDIVVADNASEDDSVQILTDEFPQVKLIRLSRNYGFAGGYNKALHKLDSDLFLLLNSDIEVSPGWLGPLLEWMKYHEDCGMCAPVLHMMNDRSRFEYAGAAGGYLDRFCYPFCRGRVMKMTEKDEGQYDVPEEVLWATGAALLVRSKVFFELGGFCDKFFAHMEEIDLCWRARLNGWKVNIVPRSTVYHVGGGSLPQDSPFKLFLNYRNNLLMMARCLPKTFAIESAYSLMSKAILPDEGPDMIHNCNCMYSSEYDVRMREDILHSSAELGVMKADLLINARMVLDFLSAMAYLVTFRMDNFKAVMKAHREFRLERPHENIKELKRYLRPILEGERDDIARNILCNDPECDNRGGDIFQLKGMWSKWIVTQALLKKEAIFAEIKDNIR